MDKDKASNEDAEKPIYKHSWTPEGKVRFSQGDVLAEAGLSGMPVAYRSKGKSYFTLTINKYSPEGKVTKNVTIQDLYKEAIYA